LAKQGIKITPLAFQMKALASALKAFPTFNSSLEPGGHNLILKKYFNIGIAVDTPAGLMVPVVKDVDQKGIVELGKEVGELAQRARDRKLKPIEMQGACITISSLGGIGGTSFTPIVNPPEVAILGVTRSEMKPVWNGSEFIPRLMLPVSLAFDHRVIDGAEAARFVNHVAAKLSDIRRLML
jgi:pyruvate dehydrogenase E2 component (dihydrolipoamide acetyltransferase)